MKSALVFHWGAVFIVQCLVWRRTERGVEKSLMEGFPEEWQVGGWLFSLCSEKQEGSEIQALLSMPHASLLGESAPKCEPLSHQGALRVAGTCMYIQRTELGPPSDSHRY